MVSVGGHMSHLQTTCLHFQARRNHSASRSPSASPSVSQEGLPGLSCAIWHQPHASLDSLTPPPRKSPPLAQ